MSSELYEEINRLTDEVNQWKVIANQNEAKLNEYKKYIEHEEFRYVDCAKINDEQADKIRSLMKECDRLVEQRSFLLSVIKGDIR